MGYIKGFSSDSKPDPRFIQKDKTRIWLGMAREAFSRPYPRFILLDKTRIWLGMARKAFSIPYPRFILLDKTRIWLGMAREAFSIPYPRFILLDKTRIWLRMAREAFYIPYPRFILLDKTRIWLGMAREAFYIPYPRFILLDKTRIWLGKHVSQEFMISVRPSVRPSATHPSVRPSVRHSSVRPYPRFILTRLAKLSFKIGIKISHLLTEVCSVFCSWLIIFSVELASRLSSESSASLDRKNPIGMLVQCQNLQLCCDLPWFQDFVFIVFDVEPLIERVLLDKRIKG